MMNSAIERERDRRNNQRRRIQNRRRQQVRRQLMFIGVIVLLIILSVGSCTYKYIVKKAQEAAAIKKEQTEKEIEEAQVKENKGQEESEESKKKGEETQEERLERVKKEAEDAGYPKEIIKLLSKNPETIDFVVDYGAKKDSAPADTIGEVKAGEIPHLLQWDERWGYSAYGTSTLAVSGCGPTCMAMVVSGLTGDASVTPAKVAAYSMKYDYVDESNDTTWLFMEEAAQNWGLTSYEVISEETAVEAELSSGRPIICSVGPGDFTRNGHFIVLAGYDNGKVEVLDPFSRENSERTWTYEEIKDQLQGMWAYTK